MYIFYISYIYIIYINNVPLSCHYNGSCSWRHDVRFHIAGTNEPKSAQQFPASTIEPLKFKCRPSLFKCDGIMLL